MAREQTRLHLSLRDLESHRDQVQRSMRINEEVISAYRETQDEGLATIDRLYNKWIDICDLMESKRYMLTNACRALMGEWDRHLAATQSRLGKSAVGGVLDGKMMDSSIEMIYDSMMHDSTHVDEYMYVQYEYYVHVVSSTYVEVIRDVNRDHHREYCSIYEGVGEIIKDIEDDYIDIHILMRDVLDTFEALAHSTDLQIDSAVSSYVVMLTDISTFGYNPYRVDYNENIHISDLEDIEVLKEMKSILSRDDLPAPHKLYVSRIKDMVIEKSLIPFLCKFLQFELNPIDIVSSKIVSKQVNTLIREYYLDHKSDTKLREIKKLVEAVYNRFMSVVSAPFLSSHMLSAVFKSLSFFESTLPRSLVGQLITYSLFDVFIERCVPTLGPDEAVRHLKSYLIILLSFGIIKDESFLDIVYRRYSILKGDCAVRHVIGDIIKSKI